MLFLYITRFIFIAVFCITNIEANMKAKNKGTWINLGMDYLNVLKPRISASLSESRQRSRRPTREHNDYVQADEESYDDSSRMTIDLGASMCHQINGLSTGQIKLCMLFADHMTQVGQGAAKGIMECKYQFRNNKWNCSTIRGDPSVFGRIMETPSKEAAFTNAVASAGVVYSVARGCRNGQLTTCGCSEAQKPKNLNQDWNWGGCGDNIHYGYKFAKNFIDIKEREKKIQRGGFEHGRQLMNLHNNEAGRRAVISTMKISCKCHGVSGSCSLITCWQQLPSFRKVGDYLQYKYDKATKVRTTKNGRLKVKRLRLRRSIPTANDLIYMKRSPNYCKQNSTVGTLGTSGRVCELNGKEFGRMKSSVESCSVMCCGRGFKTITTQIRERCNCKFHWCCQVKCQKCRKNVTLTICN